MHFNKLVPIFRSVGGSTTELVNSIRHAGNNQPAYHRKNYQHRRNYLTVPPNGASTQTNYYTQTNNVLHSLVPHIEKSRNTCSSANQVPESTVPSSAENDHAHSVMRSMPAYNLSTYDLSTLRDTLPLLDLGKSPPPLPGINWAVLEPSAVAGSFIALSRECAVKYMDICSRQHSDLIKALIESIKHLNDTELTGVLTALTLWPPVNISSNDYFSIHNDSSNFSVLCLRLDEECWTRLHKWSLCDSYKVAELWYKLRLSRNGIFTKRMLIEFGHDLDTMEPHNIVQFMFYSNLSRSLPTNLTLKRLEPILLKIVNKITLEELGVVAMGLFKSKTFIKTDPLVDAIYTRMTTEDLSNMSDIGIGAILKLLRKSAQGVRVDSVFKLLDSMCSHLPNMSVPAQLQLVLLGTNVLVLHPKVIDDVAENFLKNLSVLRLKDMERFTFALMLYNYTPSKQPQILEKFANEIRKVERRDELNKYSKSLMSCMNYMAVMQHMPLDLISLTFHPKMVAVSKQIRQNYIDFGRELMELDFMMELEGPKNYKGYRLSSEQRRELLETYGYHNRLPDSSASKKTHQEKNTSDVVAKLKSLLNAEVATTFIVPYLSTPDLVMCTTETGEPVSVPKAYLEQSSYSSRRPTAGLRYTAVIIGGRNAYVRGTPRLRGQLEMKTRHLRLLGYHVAVLPMHEYGRRNVQHKITTLDGVLVAAGALRPDSERLERACQELRGPVVLERVLQGSVAAERAQPGPKGPFDTQGTVEEPKGAVEIEGPLRQRE